MPATCALKQRDSNKDRVIIPLFIFVSAVLFVLALLKPYWPYLQEAVERRFPRAYELIKD
ncbi:hypothetical protein ROZALSC1DRAFT_29492 [Rozella allomycis CSF55]|uniref:Uncharacterized protein n=1 Tax=Rozella allomycis (strain CSF55) TaxID=988480 RepID=A0A075ASJ3_ROZAC|nr:hypothetical protein O9G_003106 [Rozella allomycis CSF55]RKP18849.1 hypothetical protein ROZALSC1DRAFT_29492 [Rozella allomycis CSF55]|eukprot:EPZ33110.1 hypothetical protein O9G_003106 [Rozella allomycis CSF55]